MEQYYTKQLLAMIKGNFMRNGIESELLKKNIDKLTENEIESIFAQGKKQGLRLYHFKRSERILPRISKVLGILRGLYFESLLDVGSGRGAFLLPFMDTFPYVSIKSIDILDKRFQMLKDMENGGLEKFTVAKQSICDTMIEGKSVDVVTLLEVLEHIPEVEKAIENAVRIARKYVIVSVPSKEDDNEEHIHLLTREKLESYFNAYNVEKISFDEVNEHLIAIIKI